MRERSAGVDAIRGDVLAISSYHHVGRDVEVRGSCSNQLVLLPE
jgi:hypothetical protein